MGAGIAQTAAQGGWEVALRDVDEATVDAAIAGIGKRLDRLVEKNKLTADERAAIGARLRNGMRGGELAACELVIEAIVEDMTIKTRVMKEVAGQARTDAILATNTSSLSVAAIGEGVGAVERTVGMHFFNPVPLMKLVEIISGERTDPAVADRAAKIATTSP